MPLKISQMNSAATPLTGSEVVPALQSSANVQTTVDAIGARARVPLAAPTGAGLVGWIRSAINAVATTIAKWLGWQPTTPFDFMTDAQRDDVRAGTLLQDVSVPVARALAFVSTPIASTLGRTLSFPDGQYLITQNNWIGANLSVAGVYGGRFDLTMVGTGRNSSVIRFRPATANGACYDQTLTPTALLNGFRMEKLGMIFDNSANGAAPVHFVNSLAAPNQASQNFRLSETRFTGVSGSVLFTLNGSVNEDVISAHDTTLDGFKSVVVSQSNLQALLHHFYALDALNITGDLFNYSKGGFLKVYGANVIMTGTPGVDTAVLRTGNGTTSQSYAFDNLRAELRGANTRLLNVPVAAENTISFTNFGIAATTNNQAWALVVAQHHASITFENGVIPSRTGVGDAGTLQLVDSTSGTDYSSNEAAHSTIKFIGCNNAGGRLDDVDGWVDYSHLTAPNANFRTFLVSYEGCGNLPDSVEYGHLYRMGRTFVQSAPQKLIFRGLTFPTGDGVGAAVVSTDDLNCVVPLNNFVTEIVVMRKAMVTAATNYQIQFIDTAERTTPGTGVIFGTSTAVPNNGTISQRVPILRQFTGTRAQRTIWCRMSAGFTLGASVGTPTDGGIYAEVI